MNFSKKRTRPLLLATTVAAVSMLTACSGGASADSAQVTLDMAAGSSPETGQGHAYARWMEELQERSNGEISITEFWNGELLGEDEVKDGLQDGRAQLGVFSYAYSPNEFPLTQMVEV